MKVCWTQPAWLAWIPSFSVVALALSRKAFAAAAVGAADEDGAGPQPNDSAQTPAMASVCFIRRVYLGWMLTFPLKKLFGSYLVFRSRSRA